MTKAEIEAKYPQVLFGTCRRECAGDSRRHGDRTCTSCWPAIPKPVPWPGGLRGADKLHPHVTELVQAFKFNAYEIVSLVVEGPRAAVHARANVTSMVNGDDRGYGTRRLLHVRGRTHRHLCPVLRHGACRQARDQDVTAPGSGVPRLQPASFGAACVALDRRDGCVPPRRRCGTTPPWRAPACGRAKASSSPSSVRPAAANLPSSTWRPGCWRRRQDGSRCSARRSPALTAMPAISFNPTRCFRGRPRSRTSPSASRSRAAGRGGPRARQGMARAGRARRRSAPAIRIFSPAGSASASASPRC